MNTVSNITVVIFTRKKQLGYQNPLANLLSYFEGKTVRIDHNIRTDIYKVYRCAELPARHAVRAAMIVLARMRQRDLLVRFRGDQSGSYVIITALLLPVLVGFAGMGTEIGLWFYKHRFLQNTADSAAVSAATAYSYGGSSSDMTVQAQAVTASYGFVHGVKDVVVTVNRPPKSGKYTAMLDAIEVIVQEPQPRFFTALWNNKEPVPVSARAVAMGSLGTGCVLALNATANAAGNAAGTAYVNLIGCSLFDNSNNPAALSVDGAAHINALSVGVVGDISGKGNITTTQGVATGISPVKDPYADVSPPPFSGCNYNHFSSHTTETINPGVYCNGVTINAGAVVTLNPGTYYLDRGTFRVNGGATIKGTGVTLVFTSSTGSNWADATINGGSTVELTPLTSGPTAGISVFGDRNMPIDTAFNFNGGATQNIGGAIYVSKGAVNYSGGANSTTGCTQLIADKIKFSGNSNFAINCKGSGTKPLGIAATLVE